MSITPNDFFSSHFDYTQLSDALTFAKNERSSSKKNVYYLVRDQSGNITTSSNRANVLSIESLESLKQSLRKERELSKDKTKYKDQSKNEKLLEEAIIYQKSVFSHSKSDPKVSQRPSESSTSSSVIEDEKYIDIDESFADDVEYQKSKADEKTPLLLKKRRKKPVTVADLGKDLEKVEIASQVKEFQKGSRDISKKFVETAYGNLRTLLNKDKGLFGFKSSVFKEVKEILLVNSKEKKEAMTVDIEVINTIDRIITEASELFVKSIVSARNSIQAIRKEKPPKEDPTKSNQNALMILQREIIHNFLGELNKTFPSHILLMADVGHAAVKMLKDWENNPQLFKEQFIDE